MRKLVNMTVHPLTAEQKETAEKTFNIKEFLELKALQPELFALMANSPDDSDKLQDLANRTVGYMLDLAYKYNAMFHLPIGSPAFNFALAKLIGNAPQLQGRIIFSHSERVSQETTLPDGSIRKENIFSFKKFIQF